MESKTPPSQLSRFMGHVLHDLKSPLTQMGLFTTLIQRRLGGRLTAEDAELFGHLTNASQAMNSMIKGLEEYFTIQEKRQYAKIDTGELVEKARLELEKRISELGARIESADLPVVMGDKAALARLFYHLIDNSLRFSKPGIAPEIFISARQVESTWEFIFRDNGIGIPDGEEEKIFEPFVSGSNIARERGKGVGLFLAREIVNQHGGSIVAKSHSDGSVFTVSLPLETVN